MATPPEQVMGHLTEEQVARLIYIHETLPGLLPTFLEDTPATEPFLDYITDLEVRCDILEKLQDLVRMVGFFKLLCETAVDGMRAYLPTGATQHWTAGAPQDPGLSPTAECFLTGVSDPVEVHFFPFSTCRDKNLLDIKAMLDTFWGSEKTEAWSQLFENEAIIESPQNLIGLNRQMRFWMKHALFALKPLRKTDNEVVVQFHWLRDACFLPRDPVFTPAESDDVDEVLARAGLEDNMLWGQRLFAHRRSGRRIKTGQTFVFWAGNLETLPNFELLQLSWELLRVAAISGAVKLTDDLPDDDGDDEVFSIKSWSSRSSAE
ncbi:hypothetical protein QBC33DRAFT_563466 [Phialemonium atrogriseum]|uniref:HNH nuclease domain-containing protein n=1 Tax=Phialemonium atrogriseum TaxID=1093897 RepID=A0AAJ0BQZ2_9PEZI|nr:uncharacterized protein QBC33DRAFT_563466 [Phialemonium atrogriseum]KAK1762863.1 hypothetical protein QBC33DRAFT_563466 [Phialemonium atrogriseum]